MAPLRLGPHSLEGDAPILLQVEAGVTHCGNLRKALALAEAAAAAGFQVYKAQVCDPDKLLADASLPFTDDRGDTYPIGVALESVGRFSFDEWRALRDHCHAHGLTFYATADYLEGVDLLEALGVPAHKACAHDLTYLPLLAAMRATGKPVLYDLGPATADEEAAAWAVLDPVGIPMHSPHPTPAGDWQMARLREFQSVYEVWGYSSPDRRVAGDFAAVGLGARILEKRLTLNRADPDGHHHTIALEPDEARDWVREIRALEAAFREDAWGYGSPTQQTEMGKWRRHPSDWKRPLARP
jgi:sialic acid synthase SpsE